MPIQYMPLRLLVHSKNKIGESTVTSGIPVNVSIIRWLELLTLHTAPFWEESPLFYGLCKDPSGPLVGLQVVGCRGGISGFPWPSLSGFADRETAAGQLWDLLAQAV